jgi:ubiquinone/menaquinone biosynthesis C-methylase UbiE
MSQPIPEPLEPSALMQMHFSFAPARTLTAAVQLDVFSALADGPRDAQEVAVHIGATPRGTRMLLDALTGLQLLTKDGGRYRLGPLAQRYLVRRSPEYLGSLFESEALWRAWAGLTEAIRSGRPAQRVDQQEQAQKFFPILVRSLHVANRGPAERLAQALGVADRRPLTVLDVGCGSGVWGITIAEAARHARVTALDFPRVLELTREYASQHGVQDRFDYLEGNLRTVDLGEARFDLSILGNIVHTEGEESSRALMARLKRATRPGGSIVIVDMVPNDERTGPIYPLLFALNMLVNTEAGDTFTLTQYTEWLLAAGFAQVRTCEIGLHSPAIVATRP